MPKLSKILYIKWRFRFKYWLSQKSIPQYVNIYNKKKCFVFLAADYGNLGDVAITYAQESFLKEHFPEYVIIDVPISKTLSHLKAIKNSCTSEDVITIVGGGNMSDLYFDIEILRQMVVKAFPHNRVIIFPQTMFFSDTIAGRYLKRLAKRVYSCHHHLTNAAREQWSDIVMKEMLPQCLLLPDIVMTLDKREPATQRNGVTICLRNDTESSLSKEFKDELRAKVTEMYDVTDYDTHIGRGNLSVKEREDELDKIWTHFRNSEWVITDRLHGMIFAFITGTPCIVLPNNNYKIEGCYSWIKDCGYVFFKSECDIKNIVETLHSKGRTMNYDKVEKRLINKFEKLCQP